MLTSFYYFLLFINKLYDVIKIDFTITLKYKYNNV